MNTYEKDVKNISESAQAFLSRCYFENGAIASINLSFDETYIIKGKKYKFTQEVLNELVESGKVKLTHQSKKLACLMGR